MDYNLVDELWKRVDLLNKIVDELRLLEQEDSAEVQTTFALKTIKVSKHIVQGEIDREIKEKRSMAEKLVKEIKELAMRL